MSVVGLKLSSIKYSHAYGFINLITMNLSGIDAVLCFLFLQILEIDKIRHLFTGREGFEDIIRALEELREETESLLRTNFEIWCNQSLSEVKSGGKLRYG